MSGLSNTTIIKLNDVNLQLNDIKSKGNTQNHHFPIIALCFSILCALRVFVFIVSSGSNAIKQPAVLLCSVMSPWLLDISCEWNVYNMEITKGYRSELWVFLNGGETEYGCVLTEVGV